MAKRRGSTKLVPTGERSYGVLVEGIGELLERARRTAARTVNSILTATYWEIGRRIVEFEQGGKVRAEYGEALLRRLGEDLTARYGRGFSWRNLFRMRNFYLGWEILPTPSAKFEAGAGGCDAGAGEILPTLSAKFEARAKLPAELIGLDEILPTLSGKSQIPPTPSAESPIQAQGEEGEGGRPICPTLSSKFQILQTPSAESGSTIAHVQTSKLPLVAAFPLSWSQYVRLMSVDKPHARAFYEAEAIRGGWSVRQLDRQISTQFFERTAHSKRQAAMLARGQKPKPEDAVSVQDEMRDPYLLEFLNLKDEYSETELEDALIGHLESFLLELGAGFTFVARQKRIRIGDTWYRIDLLLYHRSLRCLVVIDLKVGSFTHADAGQMNLYLNYVGEHLTLPDESAPVGIILCSDKDDAVVQYALGGINARVFASKYLTQLPDAETLRQEILATKRALATRAITRGENP